MEQLEDDILKDKFTAKEKENLEKLLSDIQDDWFEEEEFYQYEEYVEKTRLIDKLYLPIITNIYKTKM